MKLGIFVTACVVAGCVVWMYTMRKEAKIQTSGLAEEGTEEGAEVTDAGGAANDTAQQEGAKVEAPEDTGKRIYDASKVGDMDALRPLVQEWSGNDVLNWAYLGCYGWTPLIIGSREGRLEAVKLLLATPGETRC